MFHTLLIHKLERGFGFIMYILVRFLVSNRRNFGFEDKNYFNPEI